MMNAPSKIEAEKLPFKLRSTLKKPVHCFAVRLDALLRVRPFISTEMTRYYLGGVFVHAHDSGGAVCAATDGHRLGVRRDVDGLVNEPQIIRLPKEIKTPVREHARAWAVMTRTGPLFAHLSLVDPIHDRDHDTPENAIARIDDCYQRFGDVLIDGTFPDYTRILPAEAEADVVRGFNAKYLTSFGQSLTIRGGQESDPHVILDSSDPDFLGVLMPMRISGRARQDWTRSLAYPSKGDAA
jgi:hypothetical protein